MKALKNIINIVYIFSIIFSITLGSMMEYFGNDFGKVFLILGVTFATYEYYKMEKN